MGTITKGEWTLCEGRSRSTSLGWTRRSEAPNGGVGVPRRWIPRFLGESCLIKNHCSVKLNLLPPKIQNVYSEGKFTTFHDVSSTIYFQSFLVYTTFINFHSLLFIKGSFYNYFHIKEDGKSFGQEFCRLLLLRTNALRPYPSETSRCTIYKFETSSVSRHGG